MKLMKQEKKKNESSDSDTEFSQSEIPKSGQQHDHTYHSYVKPDELIKNYEEKIDALKKQFEKERAEQKDEYDKMKRELRYENNLLKKSLEKIKKELLDLTDEKHVNQIVKNRLKDHFSESDPR